MIMPWDERRFAGVHQAAWPSANSRGGSWSRPDRYRVGPDKQPKAQTQLLLATSVLRKVFGQRLAWAGMPLQYVLVTIEVSRHRGGDRGYRSPAHPAGELRADV